jgi:hypothetical protein
VVVSVDGATVDDRINGGTAQNFSQETVQEFQVERFSFDPASAMSGTGGISIVSRRGSNELHGAASFYYRDHNMAAYPGFAVIQVIPTHFLCGRNRVSDLVAL